jgi:outer membrane immunogenic protein
MRRFALALLASTSLLGLASVAEAADLAIRKAPPPPPPPPLWSWTGFYLGAHVGAGWSRKEFHTPNALCVEEFDGFGFGCENGDRGSHNAIGGLGGGQIGFNWQTGWVLFGIEGQYSWAKLKGDHADSTHIAFGELGDDDLLLVDAQSRFSSEIKGIGTIAARLGIVSGPQDRTLFYVKGGAAYVKEDFREKVNGDVAFFDLADPAAFPFNFSADLNGTRSKWGWMVGAGVEWGLWDNWSAKIEYNYLDFGKGKDVTLSGDACVSFLYEDARSPSSVCSPFAREHKVDQNIQLIKFGLNYRFGWFGKAPAVMAKY